MKKTIAKMLVFSVTVTLPFMAGNIVYTPADEEIKVTLEEKIENEIENHTTDIPQNIECKLNAYGISDENIKNIPEEIIHKIEESNGSIKVEVQYYGCKDSENASDADNSEVDENFYEFQQKLENETADDEMYETVCMIPMTEDEVNEVVDFSEDKVNEGNSSSVMSSFCKNAYADGYEDVAVDNYDGVVQVVMLMTYGRPLSNGLRTVSVYEYAEWVKRPKYTGEDVLGITFPTTVLVDKETLGRQYTYQYKDHSNPGIYVYFNHSASLSKLPVKYNNEAVAMTADLANDTASATAQKHCLAIWVDGIVSDRSVKYVNAVGHYFHKVKKISNKTTVVLGVNSNSGGYIQAYNTSSRESLLHEVPNNPVCAIRFK